MNKIEFDIELILEKISAFVFLAGIPTTDDHLAKRRELCGKYQLIDPYYEWGFPWEYEEEIEPPYDPMADYVDELRKGNHESNAKKS